MPQASTQTRAQAATPPPPSAARSLLRRLIPTEFQPPRDVPRRALAAVGYFRLRTWMAAHGEPVPDAWLYQPLYSPWAGEPSFEAVYRKVRPHTLVSRDRCYLLWRTLQQATHRAGAVLECGVYRGGTALLVADTLQAAEADRPIHLFDSFEGMPQTTTGIDRFERGDLATTSVDQVRALLSPYPSVSIHAGYIPDTFEGLQLDRVVWAHVDVDTYQSVLDCIEFIYPRLLPGGYLVFDDYGFPSCASARRAVDEAFADRPEVPLCLPTGQCLVVKLP
jgi:O-methyltransferase